MGKRFAITHWLSMGIGGRIPPLLDAFARLVCLILPWFGFFVMHPERGRKMASAATQDGSKEFPCASAFTSDD
jgi:hypothetical protein